MSRIRKRVLSGRRSRSIQRDLRKATIAIISAIPFTLLLSSIGVFRQVETPILDALMHLREPPGSSEVVIVRITDADYRTIFNGKSPLDPAALQKIITAIARGKPKVIGVDINTAPPQFQSIEPEPAGTRVIWAREANYSNRDKKFYLADVLGGKTPAPESGLVLLKLDKDGVIRRYTRMYDTNLGDFSSLSWALIKESKPESAEPNARIAG